MASKIIEKKSKQLRNCIPFVQHRFEPDDNICLKIGRDFKIKLFDDFIVLLATSSGNFPILEIQIRNNEHQWLILCELRNATAASRLKPD